MKERLIILIFLLLSTRYLVSFSQELDCKSELSKAEQAYSSGKFNDISSTLCDCLGIRLKVKKDSVIVSPGRYRRLLDSLRSFENQGVTSNLGSYSHISDTLHAHSMFTIRTRNKLVNNSYIKGKKYNQYFNKYQSTIIEAPRTPIGQLILDDSILVVSRNNSDLNFKQFSTEEKFRAYSLLGQVYYQLGSYESSELIAKRMVADFPGQTYNDEENKGFEHIYNKIRSNKIKIGGGALIGWQYYFPINIKNNTIYRHDFKYIPGGNLLLGGHIDLLYQNFSFNLWIYGNRNEIECRLYDKTTNELAILLKEEQVWFKIPVLYTWHPKTAELFTSIEDLSGRFFIRVGPSLNWLGKSEGMIYTSELDQIYPDERLTDYRNRFNIEMHGGFGISMRYGRSSWSFSFNGMFSVFPYAKKPSSNTNSLYLTLDLDEINYHSLTGYWNLSYLWLF